KAKSGFIPPGDVGSMDFVFMADTLSDMCYRHITSIDRLRQQGARSIWSASGLPALWLPCEKREQARRTPNPSRLGIPQASQARQRQRFKKGSKKTDMFSRFLQLSRGETRNESEPDRTYAVSLSL